MRMIACLQLGWALGVLLLGTAARGAEYHVSPGGSSAGDGSPDAPWDLETALSGAVDPAGKARIGPGDTVWLHGGTYRGGFASKLEGTQESPVTVRQATGERAIIDTRPRDERDDGLFNVDGDHSVFWGFEVTCSDPRRETKLSGSWPDDIRRGGLFSRASHVKFINLIVHDTAGGFGFWSAGIGGEVYGCLIYHNGWKGPDRGHGHAIYAQNRHGTKRLIDNVMFNQFGYGIHCYGSEKAFLSGFLIEGNACFNNGCLANLDDRSPGIMVGGGTRVERVTIKDNATYGGSLQLGYYWGGSNADATVEDNYIAGGLYVRDFEQLTLQGNTIVGQNTLVRFENPRQFKTSAYQWDANTYFRSGNQYPAFSVLEGEATKDFDLNAWRQGTGLDHRSHLVQDGRPDNRVFVRPNRYEPGRAHVVVYNWEKAETVDLDLGQVLSDGMRYRIVSAQDFFGPPVLEGTYEGRPVPLPMRPTPPVQPVGMPDYPLPVTEPEFGVFVVLPVP